MADFKIKSTTQNFTEVEDVTNNLVFFKGGYIASILEVSSVNFYLLSQEEQDARIYGFMSLLNSLSFAIQILIVSKNVDVSSYLNLVDQKINAEKRPKILEYLKHYRAFVESLIKSKSLLDKKFYIVIPFSTLELGATISMKSMLQKGSENLKKAENALATKRANVMTQLSRIGLGAHELKTEEIAKLLFEMFNQEQLTVDFSSSDVKNIIV